jgi:hypothetical protein
MADDGEIILFLAIGVVLLVAMIIGIVDMRARGESWKRMALGTLSASLAIAGMIVAWLVLGIFSLALIIPIAVAAIRSSERRRAARSR